jgi:putative transposase
MGQVVRGKLMAALGHAYDKHAFASFDDFDDPQGFARLMARLPRRSWNVYAKAPFKKGRHVLDYLGRYTHRVGIANSRLRAVSGHAVTFRTKGQGLETVTPVEFLRRLVRHVLPDGFHKIRHVGLYAPAAARRCETARARLGATSRPRRRCGWRERLVQLTGRDVTRCPRCGGPLVTLVAARCRDPPPLAA